MRIPKRVLAYVRVSGSEQGRTGTSLEGQRDAVVRWCAYHELPAPTCFVEVASAGAEKLERRVELKRLLDTAQAGDMIVVTKVDRWSRDIVWGVQSVRALVKRGVDWHSIGENLDASTQQGDSTLGIMAWVADQERLRIKERTVGRRKELRDAGLYIEGRVPVGYERHERRMRIVPRDAEIVREVYRRSIDGDSIGTLCAWLRRTYPKRHGWDHKSVQHMLRSRAYLGEITTSSGVWVPSHDPIIDHATWQRAQEGLDSRRLGGRRHESVSRTASWLLRTVSICAECDAKMGSAYSRYEGSGGYYACSARLAGRDCDAPYVPVSTADAEMSALILWRLKQLRKELSKGATKPAAPVEDFEAKRERLRQRRARTIDLAADGTITREDMLERLGRIEREVGALELEADASARRVALRSPERRAELLDSLDVIEIAWRKALIPQKQAILRRLVRAVRLHVNEKPAPIWLEVEEMRTLEVADVNHFCSPTRASREGSDRSRRAVRPRKHGPGLVRAFRAASAAWLRRSGS